MSTQLSLLPGVSASQALTSPRQLLKWVGNKQRFARDIGSLLPARYRCYIEPFLGSGAVLGTLAPSSAIASDSFGPLMEIWQTLQKRPKVLESWYSERWQRMRDGDRRAVYEDIKAAYNANPNGADLVFLCRSCYGGIVRFRRTDGHMSTPIGAHQPISPVEFANRVTVWHQRVEHVRFVHADFEEVMARARREDVIYCDPPYSDTQSILYGAQSFDLSRLFEAIEQCRRRDVRVVMSIDGTKKSGDHLCDVLIPEGVFERELWLDGHRSMLRRFQLGGQTLESEVVSDRLLLTY